MTYHGIIVCVQNKEVNQIYGQDIPQKAGIQKQNTGSGKKKCSNPKSGISVGKGHKKAPKDGRQTGYQENAARAQKTCKRNLESLRQTICIEIGCDQSRSGTF